MSGPDRPALAALVEAAMGKHVVPGVAIGAVDAEGARTFSFGITNVDHPLPVDADTVFEIASITKTMTATAAARLAAEGRLELDAPVARYVTDLRTPDPGVASRVTVRDLFTHTAGWFGEYLTPTGSGDDAMLRDALLEAARTGEARFDFANEHGQQYLVDFEMVGPSERAEVRSRWIIETGTDFPRLATCYVRKRRRRRRWLDD